MRMRAMTPGTATTGEVARHWGVHHDTVRAIMRAAGVEPVGHGRWRWRDVWRVEGSPCVPAIDWVDFKTPLMDAKACAAEDRAAGRNRCSERTWRRRLQGRALPVIELAPGLRRVRRMDYEAHADSF